MSDGKVVYEVRADYDKLDSDLSGANSKIEKGTSKWGSLLKGVGAGIGGFIAAKAVEAVKAIYDLGTAFESNLAKVSTLVDTASVDMDQLGDSLLDLSSKYGLEADSLANSAYNAISSNNALGKDTEGLMRVLESSAKLAKAGFTDVDTAASATLKTLNAYGLGVESVDRIQKILIQTQNTGITTVGELGAVLAQVTPSAAAVGIQFEEVGAALATMTAQGTPAAQATTQLNAVITAFLKPTDTLRWALEDITDGMLENGQMSGDLADRYEYLKDEIKSANKQLETMSTKTDEEKAKKKELQNQLKELETEYSAVTSEIGLQIIQTEGLQGTLELLNKEFGGSTSKMAAALSSSEALKASLAITGENAETFTSNLEAMSTEADVVDESFAKVNGTLSSKVNIAFTAFKNILIEAFNAVTPVLGAVADFITLSLKAVDIALSPLLSLIKSISSAIKDLASALTNRISKSLDVVSGWVSSLTSKVKNLWSTITGGASSSKSSGRSFAVGKDFVPEDNYPALLHRGEAVLTAAEAKVWRAGGNTRTGQLSGTTGGASIDYDKLARAMSGMTVVMDKQTVGYILTPEISHNQAMNSDSMERSGFNG